MERRELTPEEVGEYLSSLTPGIHETGRIPYPIFMAERTHLPSPCIEVVLFSREEDGSTSLVLTRRPENDPVWPGMVGLAGTQVTEKDLGPHGWIHTDPRKRWEGPLNRLRNKELSDTNVNLSYVGDFPVTS